MNRRPIAGDDRPAWRGLKPQVRFSLGDLALTVTLVAVGFALVRALGENAYIGRMAAIYGAVNLPFLCVGWLRLWRRPIPRFREARHWLLVGLSSAIIVALMAMASPFFRVDGR